MPKAACCLRRSLRLTRTWVTACRPYRRSAPEAPRRFPPVARTVPRRDDRRHGRSALRRSPHRTRPSRP
ncbi:hypothetical protein DBR33_23535 [Stenotrophomonas sp. HMWF022]|nr:hypothetical protein DBR33_23535 [Stenotrophomonas sp. HMWF022]